MFPTTVAGSLPKPSWLAEPDKLWPQWRLSGARSRSRQARRHPARAQDAGRRRHRHRQRRRAIAPALRARLPRIRRRHRFRHKVEMGIRDDRYKAMVPTVTGALRSRAACTTPKRAMRAPTPQAQAQDHPARPDDDRRHGRRPHYGDRIKMAIGVRRAAQRRRRARWSATASTSSSSTSRRSTSTWTRCRLGHRGAASRHRRAQMHHRRAHLLRLRHQGQYRLEGHARRRVAAVRRDLPGARGEQDQPGLGRVRNANVPLELMRCSRARTSWSA